MSDASSGTWFGVSMFLFGLIAGAAVMIGMSGGLGQQGGSPTVAGNGGQPNVQAPTEPTLTGNALIASLVSEVGLDEDEFETCFSSGKYSEKVSQEMDMGRAEGVSGTPGNVIVNIKTGQARLLSGAQPFQNFEQVIDDLIANPNGPNSIGTPEPTNPPTVDTVNDKIRGNRNADIAVIEYSDYECPFCKRVHPTYEQIVEEYGDQVMWVYRHFPLDSIHPNARPYAMAAECANELGGNDAFWSFTDAFFAI